jgi:hypothetical protein
MLVICVLSKVKFNAKAKIISIFFDIFSPIW